MRFAGEGIFWGAHATRVLHLATRQMFRSPKESQSFKVRGESPQTARESRALPR